MTFKEFDKEASRQAVKFMKDYGATFTFKTENLGYYYGIYLPGRKVQKLYSTKAETINVYDDLKGIFINNFRGGAI